MEHPMKWQLVGTDDRGFEESFDLESIQVIPRDVDLVFWVPEEIGNVDFGIMSDQLQQHLGENGRKVLIVRKGDLELQGIERPKVCHSA
jgi:hypothetical protein